MSTHCLSAFSRKRRKLAECPPCSPTLRDLAIYPWNWHEEAGRIELSPGGTCSSSETPTTPKLSDQLRRGRPRLDEITSLILEGSSSPSGIKCDICNRVFPREKSLQTHLRTHTGEKPYICDYPSCSRAFAQSGQLKTHQRLHAGEKPFKCSYTGCLRRFTHSNRHCSAHPYAVLERDEANAFQQAESENKSQDVLLWLERYQKERRQWFSVKQRKLKKELDAQAALDHEELRTKCAAGGDRMLGALALIELACTTPAEEVAPEAQQPLDLSMGSPKL